MSSSLSPTILQFQCLSSLSPYHFKEIPVARHAAAHAEVVAEREAAKCRGDAHEHRVARELADGLFESGGAAVGGACLAPRCRQDWGRHVAVVATRLRGRCQQASRERIGAKKQKRRSSRVGVFWRRQISSWPFFVFWARRSSFFFLHSFFDRSIVDLCFSDFALSLSSKAMTPA